MNQEIQKHTELGLSDLLIKPFLYESSAQYSVVLPEYHFAEGTDMEMAASKLNKLASRREKPVTLVDCGAGPGRVWEYLGADFATVVAVEPSRGMWRADPPSNVKYVESGAFEFLKANPSTERIVSFLWSVNYPLLSFFEKYDPKQGKVIQFDAHKGDADCRAAVREVLERNSGSDYFIMVFDDESPEQQFVTSVWEREAPFPFNDRSYTRRLLLDEMQRFAEKSGALFTQEHHAGFADYGPGGVALSRMLNFHLRGHFNNDPEVVQAAATFLSSYRDDSTTKVPVGMHILQLQAVP
jgi:hypothetical protein